METASKSALKAIMKARICAMLVGAPGTTKTATVRSIAEEMGYDLITIVPSRMDAQDISGFPTRGELTVTINGESKTVPMTEYAPQYWQHEIMNKKKVILFLDEFSNAHPSTRASLLSFIQDRQFPNGDYFPEETILVGAMNPTDSAADGYELDKATTNRMVFLSWKPDNSEWLEGMKDNWGRGCKSKLEEEWRLKIVRFLRDEPGFIHRENDEEITNGAAYGVDASNSSDMTVVRYAWASRRSWDNLSMILPQADGNEYLEDLLISGTVGYSAANAFRNWLIKHGALGIEKIIKDPDGYQGWNDLTLDQMNKVLSAAIDGVNNDTVENVIRIFEIVSEMDKRSYAAQFGNRFAGIMHNVVIKDTKKREDLRKRHRAALRNFREESAASRNSRRLPEKKSKTEE